MLFAQQGPFSSTRHDNDHAHICDIRILPTTNEILTTTEPYLPVYDSSKWHLAGLKGLLDRHFRLLREDNFGPVKDVLRTHLQGGQTGMKLYHGNSMRTNEYKIQSIRVAFDDVDGFELHLSTRQPPEVGKRLTPAHREQWWMETNNLDWERLVCLIGHGRSLFCMVSRATCRNFAQLTERKDKSKKRRPRAYDPKRTLFGARDLAHFVLKPVDPDPNDIDFMLNTRTNTDGGMTVVEFPTLLLASFKPMLSTLQTMYTSPQIPLSEYLVGKVGRREDEAHVDEHIPPPIYAMNNFQFNLRPITKNQCDFLYSPRHEPNTEDVCAKTFLDDGQARALLNTLRRRLALIQGPPGTGKSYTGEAIIDVLLANKNKANLGPIICICQTNHALDQLLEHLYIRKGIRRIVRLGTQSKSAVIGELTLQKLMDSRPPQQHELINTGKRAKARKKAARKVKEALMEFEMAEPAHQQELLRCISEFTQVFEMQARKVDEAWADRKITIVREFDVIGVTISGLARFRDWLSGVKSKVVVCEEAGEVLEAHTLSALMPSTQHLILIGDHEQLHPTTNVYDFQRANPYGALIAHDISLFERFVKPLLLTDKKLPFDTLDIQRRMHPSISQLVRSTLYPRLKDAENVKQYPELAGFKRRLFWFHHTKFEDGSNGDRGNESSFSNRFEIEVVKTVLAQLTRQNVYTDGEIAVLTPYASQLRQLKIQLGTIYDVRMNELDTAELERRNMMVNVDSTRGRRHIRVATVDNFQGEEASVVVISLVRSNAARKCGFLNQSNRINVLLSRAKHGMIIIGNAETYSPNDMWWDIIQMMRDSGNMGTSFELPCPRHQEKTVLACSAHQFSMGGCTEDCNRPLACGHICSGSCHPMVVHDNFKCQVPCGASLDCGHACSNLCHRGRACQRCTSCGFNTRLSGRKMERRPKLGLSAPQLPANQLTSTKQFAIPPTNNHVQTGTLHLADDLSRLDVSVGKELISFISVAHQHLITFELALLHEQETLDNAVPSVELLRMAGREGVLNLNDQPCVMIQSVNKWLGNRYDSAVRLVEDVNHHVLRVRKEEQRLEKIWRLDTQSQRPTEAEGDETAIRLRLQCMLSLVVLLIRCNVVILADYFSLRRKEGSRKTVVSVDLTGFIRLCQFVIEKAQELCYPRHQVEAHLLIGKMITISREADGRHEGIAESEETTTAEAHLNKALGIVIKYPGLGYLIEDIEAVLGELSHSTFGSIVTSEEKRSTWQTYAEGFQEQAYWHVCANGHPFSIVEETDASLCCCECGAPVGEQGGSSIHAGDPDDMAADFDGDDNSSVKTDVGEGDLDDQRSEESLLLNI